MRKLIFLFLLFLFLLTAGSNVFTLAQDKSPKPGLPALLLPAVNKPEGLFKIDLRGGGLDVTSYLTKLAPNDGVQFTNFLWNEQGEPYRRYGYAKFNTSLITNKPIYGLYRFYKSNDSAYTVAICSTGFYVAHGQDDSFVVQPEKSFTAGKFWDFKSWFDLLFGFNIGCAPIVFNGDSLRDNGIADSGKVTDYKWANLGIIGIVDNKKSWSSNEFIGYYLWMPDNKDSTNLTDPGTRMRQITGVSYDTIMFQPAMYQKTAYTPGLTRGNRYFILSIIDTLPSIYSFIPDSSSCLGDAYGCKNMTSGSGGRWRQYWVFNDSLRYIQALRDSAYYLVISIDSTNNFIRSSNLIYLIHAKDSLTGKWAVRVGCDTTKGVTEAHNCYLLDSLKFFRTKVQRYAWLFFQYGRVHKNRLYMAGVPAYPTRLYYTELNTPEDIKAANYLEIFSNDNEEISGLMTLYSGEFASPYADLYIAKPHHLYQLSGSGSSDFALYEIATGVGIVAPYTLVCDKGVCRFLGDEKVYEFDGRSAKDISKQIEPILKNEMSRTYLYKAQGGFYDNHYYLSYVDTGTASGDTFCNQTIVYNPAVGKWSRANFSASVFANADAISDSVNFFFGSPTKGQIYKYGTSTTDTGVAINITYQSGWLNFGDLTNKKELTDLY
jgi:hypothetical protein